jgi:hypothetical protein
MILEKKVKQNMFLLPFTQNRKIKIKLLVSCRIPVLVRAMLLIFLLQIYQILGIVLDSWIAPSCILAFHYKNHAVFT